MPITISKKEFFFSAKFYSVPNTWILCVLHFLFVYFILNQHRFRSLQTCLVPIFYTFKIIYKISTCFNSKYEKKHLSIFKFHSLTEQFRERINIISVRRTSQKNVNISLFRLKCCSVFYFIYITYESLYFKQLFQQEIKLLIVKVPRDKLKTIFK